MTRPANDSEQPWRPSKAQVLAAHGRLIPDILAPGLDVVFCGINPGLYSAAVRHHFARPGNRFWPTLLASGFTRRLMSPFDGAALGCGITNIVARATAGADELSHDELVAGAKSLIRKMKNYQPKALAILGVGAYRVAFGERSASIGRQERMIGGTQVWVLPNPSGLNAHYQLDALAAEFRKLRREVARA